MTLRVLRVLRAGGCMLRASGAYPKEFSEYVASQHKTILEGDPLMQPPTSRILAPALNPRPSTLRLTLNPEHLAPESTNLKPVR